MLGFFNLGHFGWGGFAFRVLDCQLGLGFIGDRSWILFSHSAGSVSKTGSGVLGASYPSCSTFGKHGCSLLGEGVGWGSF